MNITHLPSPTPGRLVDASVRKRQLLDAAGIAPDEIAHLSADARHTLDWLAGWGPGIMRGAIELITHTAPDDSPPAPSAGSNASLLTALAQRLAAEPLETFLTDADAESALMHLGDVVDDIDNQLWTHPTRVHARAQRGDADPHDSVYVSVSDLRSVRNLDHLPGMAGAAGVVWSNAEHCWGHAVTAAKGHQGHIQAADVVNPRTGSAISETLGLVVFDGPVECVECRRPLTSLQPAEVA